MRYFFILLLIIAIPAFAYSPAGSPVFLHAKSPVVSYDVAEVAVVELPPSNTVAPTVSGDTEIGAVLTCNNGSWDYSPTSYAYTWENASVTIGGETSQTYTTVLADAGDAITCTVTATNAYGSSAAIDSSNNVTPESIPVNSVAPTVSGLQASGSTLTCNNGTWSQSPDSYTYTWERDTVTIGGETAQTYVTVLGDVGSAISCTVAATNTAGTSSAVDSSDSVTVSDGSRPADLTGWPDESNVIYNIAFGSGGVSGLTAWNREATPADDSAQADYDMRLGDGSTASTYPDASSGDYVEFDGADLADGNRIEFKSSNTAFINNMSKTTPTPSWTVATVGQFENDVASRMIWETRDTAADASGLAIYIQGDDVCITQGNGSAQMTGECNSHTATPWNFGGLNLIVVSYDGSTFESWVNNDKQSQAASFGTNTSDAGDMRISCSAFQATNCLDAGERIYYQAAWQNDISDADASTLYTTTYPADMGYNFDGSVYNTVGAGATMAGLEIDFNNGTTNIQISDVSVQINDTGNDYVDNMAIYTDAQTGNDIDPVHGFIMMSSSTYGTNSYANDNKKLWDDNAWNIGTDPDNKTAHTSGTREMRAYFQFSSSDTVVNDVYIQIVDPDGSGFHPNQVTMRDQNGDLLLFASAPGEDDVYHTNGLTGSSERVSYHWEISGTDTGTGATYPQFLGGTYTASSVFGTHYDGFQTHHPYLYDAPQTGACVVDECVATANESGGTGYIRTDFGSNKTVTSCFLAPITSGSTGGWNSAYTYQHDVKYSTDASTWTDFATEGTCATVEGVDCEETGSVTARYMAIYKEFGDSPNWVAADNFYCFGY